MKLFFDLEIAATILICIWLAFLTRMTYLPFTLWQVWSTSIRCSEIGIHEIVLWPGNSSNHSEKWRTYLLFLIFLRPPIKKKHGIKSTKARNIATNKYDITTNALMIKFHSNTIWGEFLSYGIFANTTKFAKYGIRSAILHSKITKSLQNVPKSPQITPEVPKSMHFWHIFLLGLAKKFFFTVPTPSQNWGKPPIQMAFRSPFFVSKVKKIISGHN